MSTSQSPVAIARNETLTDFNRREWLSMGTAAVGGLLPVPSSGKPGFHRIQLSLNENPFGPSPLALQAIKTHLADLSRYAGDAIAVLTANIAQFPHPSDLSCQSAQSDRHGERSGAIRRLRT